MKPMIFFSDLAHRGHACNAMPYAISLVLAYALKVMPDRFDYKLFKRADDLTAALDQGIPQIVCFSNYVWNTDLSYAIVRRIKQRAPETVVIFGGPNYPILAGEQELFLKKYPDIDFYVYREGDVAFPHLIEALLEVGLDAGKIRAEERKLPSCHYIHEGRLIAGKEMPTPNDLDELPSPYLGGLMDTFFEMNLVPLTQTTRGCPFTCTFCQDGHKDNSKVKRHSQPFVDAELEYIAQRSRAPRLQWGDSNFGMYKQDLDTCRTIARLRKQYGWPLIVDVHGKNKKERILEAASIIDGAELEGGAVFVSAAIQSTSPEVLMAVRRQNISTDVIMDLVTRGRKVLNDNSFSEIILCLPRDTRDAHFQSLDDLIDAGISVIRSHQFILLHGSEAATIEDRVRYGMLSRFRVSPRTVAEYRLFGESFISPEIDEICVGNSTLTYQEYLECRQYDLTVEIFHNHGLFGGLMAFLKANGVSLSRVVHDIFDHIMSTTTPLNTVYAGFLRETQELWDTREEVEAFLRQPGIPEKYRSGELGNNEQLMYRALAVFNHMADMHDVVYFLARKHLSEQGKLDAATAQFLDELKAFNLLRKSDILDTQRVERRVFHFDFEQLEEERTIESPEACRRPEGVTIEFSHSDAQRDMIRKYVDLYGTDNYGLGNILGGGTSVSSFYRTYRKV